jgi:hypothetical protein
VDDHDHGDHDHGHSHDHSHDHEHGHEHDEETPDVSGWLASTQKLNCPSCGATGALPLGGGIFCPTCGEVTTNAGYQAPAPAPEPESGQD